MLLFRGLTMLVLDGKSVAPFPDGFRAISTGFLPTFGGGSLHFVTILIGIGLSLLLIVMDWRKRLLDQRYKLEVLPPVFMIVKLAILVAILNYFAFLLASYKGLPNIFVLLFALIVFYTFIMRRTIMGRHIYALGGNEKAARLSGIKTKKMTFWVFVNMGVMAALAGLVFAARLNAATPKAGVNFELDAIAAAFIGGASATGGVGTVIGAIVGGLVMGVMNNGMSLVGLGIDYQQGIKGLVLLLAVAFDIYNKNKSS
jgi:putative multiple sugar transport system permease protein